MKTADCQFSKLNKLVLSRTSLCDEDNKCREYSHQSKQLLWLMV